MKIDDYLIYSGILVIILTLLYLYKIKPILENVHSIAVVAKQVNSIV